MIIKATDLVCNKVRGGRRALWHAKHPTIEGITGAGNTADNAIKDFQKQYRMGFHKQCSDCGQYGNHCPNG